MHLRRFLVIMANNKQPRSETGVGHFNNKVAKLIEAKLQKTMGRMYKLINMLNIKVTPF